MGNVRNVMTIQTIKIVSSDGIQRDLHVGVGIPHDETRLKAVTTELGVLELTDGDQRTSRHIVNHHMRLASYGRVRSAAESLIA